MTADSVVWISLYKRKAVVRRNGTQGTWSLIRGRINPHVLLQQWGAQLQLTKLSLLSLAEWQSKATFDRVICDAWTDAQSTFHSTVPDTCKALSGCGLAPGNIHGCTHSRRANRHPHAYIWSTYSSLQCIKRCAWLNYVAYWRKYDLITYSLPLDPCK